VGNCQLRPLQVLEKNSPPQPRRGGAKRRGGVGQKIDFRDQHHPSRGYASAFPSSTEEGSSIPQGEAYNIKDVLEIFKDYPVLKSKNLNSMPHEESCTAVIPLHSEKVLVAFPIEFDNDATFRTIKVGNIRTYSVLPAKLLSLQFRVAEVPPEESLSRSKVFAEIATAILQDFRIVKPLHAPFPAIRVQCLMCQT
jgi:hypothetical protein